MSYKFILPFLLMAFPLMSFSAENSQGLMNDPVLLDQYILKTEKLLTHDIAKKNQEDPEFLKVNLVHLKQLGENYQKSSGLNEAIKYSSLKAWSNTSSFLFNIQKTCTVANSKLDECFIQLQEFDDFMNSRRVSSEHKED